MFGAFKRRFGVPANLLGSSLQQRALRDQRAVIRACWASLLVKHFAAVLDVLSDGSAALQNFAAGVIE